MELRPSHVAVRSFALPPLPATADFHSGVNGWLSSWGNIGEMAGCAPERRD